MRLINADALHADLHESYETLRRVYKELEDNIGLSVCEGQLMTIIEAMARVKKAPTIEAEPVRHGRWEWYEEWGPSTWLEPPDIINEGWKCTECGIDLGEYLTAKLHEEVYVGDMDKMPDVNRCPNCGAKMDAKEEPHEAPGP